MMSSSLLSPGHIKKLGHEIEEIRRRALGNVLSKYNLQLVDESNTENNKQLFENLLNWFEFEHHPEDAAALNLILRVSKCSNFKKLVDEIGAENILERIYKIEKITDSSLRNVISEIKDVILSVRRESTDTRTSELVINHANESDTGNSGALTYEPPLKEFKTDFPGNTLAEKASSSSINYLPWQSLVSTDRQVLMAIYEGLRYIDNSASILESCQFYKDVVLKDFPSEIFLQRPLIIQTFFELCKSCRGDTKRTLLNGLVELTDYLNARIKVLMDPSLRGVRWDFGDHGIPELATEDSATLQRDQLSLYEFGMNLLTRIIDGFSDENDVEEVNLLTCILRNVIFLFSYTNNDMKCLLEKVQQIGFIKLQTINFWTLLTFMLKMITSPQDLSTSVRQIIHKYVGLPSLVLFFPKLHGALLEVLKQLNELNVLNDFKDCRTICLSLEAADKCLKTRTDNKLEYFKSFDEGLFSLEFHKSLKMVEGFIKVCLHREVSTDERILRTKILVKLLSYPDQDVCFAVHKGIHAVVKKWAGVEEIADCAADKLEFLYEEEIWKELLCFALDLTSQTTQISSLIQEYITFILKSRLLTSDVVWKKLTESISPNLDLLAVYADGHSPFGKCVARFFDPDVATCFRLPFGDILRGNARLFFNKDVNVNKTAYRRLCWMLESAPDSAEKYIDMEIFKGLDLSTICSGTSPMSDNVVFTSISSSQSLHEVLAVLRNENSDPKTRKYSLTRLDAIMKDIALDRTFFEQDGLCILIDAMDSALGKRGDRYPADSVVSIIGVLVTLARRHAAVRMQLAAQDRTILNILRALLLFNADDQFRENAVVLLFLLLYCNQIKRVNLEQPLRCQLSVTNAVLRLIHIPIGAQTHAKNSPNVIASKKVVIMSSPQFSRLLRVYWTALSLGNISTVLALEETDLQNDIYPSGTPNCLRLISTDLHDLQSSSPVHNMRGLLLSIQNATCHNDVLTCVNKLNGCLNWLETYNTLQETPFIHPSYVVDVSDKDIEGLPWISTFERFLTVPPASIEDEELLHNVLRLISRLLVLPDSNLVPWMFVQLTKPSGALSKLLKEIGSSGQSIEGRELRRTITELGHRIIYLSEPTASIAPWLEIMRLISEFFVNHSVDEQCSVAPIDWVLGLLADITGLSWDYSCETTLYETLVTDVLDILVMCTGFTEPKGSFLCTNIVGNALITLNNLLSDGALTVKAYESIWERALLKATEEESDISWLLVLTAHQDSTVRIVALSLMAGFFASNATYEMLVGKLSLEVDVVWNCGLAILFDKGECAKVKEKAAILLAKITGLGSVGFCADFTCLTSDNFFESLSSIISQPSSSDFDVATPVTTPALVGAICEFLLTICFLNSAKTSEQIANSGLLFAVLRSLVIENDCDEENLRMFEVGAKLLRMCVCQSSEAKNIVLSSHDYFRALFSYLNPKVREAWPSLVVDSLWAEILNLLSTVLVKAEPDSVAFRNALPWPPEEFLVAVTQSLSSGSSLKEAAKALVANITRPDFSDLFASEISPGESFEISTCSILLQDFHSSTYPLSNLFLVSKHAQSFALSHGLVELALQEIRKIVSKLKICNVDELRKNTGRKKVEPMLRSLEDLFSLMMHFCYQNKLVKARLADCGLADAVNQIWLWCVSRPSLTLVVLKMLCTFTEQSERACQSLALTQSPAGLRKSPGAITLIHSVIQLVCSETDKCIKSKDCLLLSLGLQILCNSCDALECRYVLAKGTVLAPLTKFISSSKKDQYLEEVMRVWLDFVAAFAFFTEGQTTLCQCPEAMEFILCEARGSLAEHRQLALIALNLISCNPTNRIRILASPADTLSALKAIIQEHSEEDVRLASTVIWSLAANSQKGKVILRSAGFLTTLGEARKVCTSRSSLDVLERTLEVLQNK